jgi:hypothetical protein
LPKRIEEYKKNKRAKSVVSKQNAFKTNQWVICYLYAKARAVG